MKKHRYVIIFLSVLFLTTLGSKGQTYYYFQDSPDNGFYDYSWMELYAPSELEREGDDLRKFPVESILLAQQGMNSLRLRWKSVSGGNWFAIAAGTGWTDHDISTTDTLLFYLRSETLLAATALPKIFMEDLTNHKSDFHLISDWTDDLQPGIWTKIKIPMQQFFDAGDGTDWTQIKTIGFTQNTADDVEHTLYIDDMRVYTGDGTADPATRPSGVTAKGYERHAEIRWDANPEPDLLGYRVERSMDGETFTIAGLSDPDDTVFVDWLGDPGDTLTAHYRVRAINSASEPSEASDTAIAGMHPFSDEELLDMVQEYTFRYFWDFGHEISGLTRERNTSGDVVTSGGSGFGLMAVPVGIERGFITREEGAERVLTALNFLENADRFHGAWSHWLNGSTGTAIPFSTKDNGGDIVETAYVAQGLLTIRQYFTGADATETAIVEKATTLWEDIEWDWYRKDGSAVIYWHWSPDYNWEMNMQVKGWNEAAIVYLLAIASPAHGVPAGLWETGWAGGTYYVPRTLYGHKLWLGTGYGGPLFFAHYSFLGFDPNDKRDAYANYFNQNRNHSLVQQAYCEDNPNGFTGYSSECWGLTASDDPDGYLAHEPGSSRDNGTISPTAALSSMPYTPEESMLALKHFYRELGDKTWDWMGFLDAFNESRDWYAGSYLAIDQGPVILMIENYRTQLLWDLFMANPEIDPMLDAIGFTYSPNSVSTVRDGKSLTLFPNPAQNHATIQFELEKAASVDLNLCDLAGNRVKTFASGKPCSAGKNTIELNTSGIAQGFYMLQLGTGEGEKQVVKLIINNEQ